MCPAGICKVVLQLQVCSNMRHLQLNLLLNIMIFRKMHIFPDCRCADGYTLHAENSHMPYCSPPTASHDEEVSHLTRFRGISVPGGQQKETPGTLLQRNRGRWTAGKDTWNAFAGIPCQVDGREETPGTLLREFRARWKAGRDTWNAFAGIPCQVDGRKSYLERFRRNSVPGGRRGKTPGTIKFV